MSRGYDVREAAHQFLRDGCLMDCFALFFGSMPIPISDKPVHEAMADISCRSVAALIKDNKICREIQ